MSKPLCTAVVLSLLLPTALQGDLCATDASSPTVEIVEPGVAALRREPVEAPETRPISEKPPRAREPVEAPEPTPRWEASAAPGASGVPREELAQLVGALRRVFVRCICGRLATQLDGSHDGVDEWTDEGDHRAAEPLAELDAVWSKMFGNALPNLEAADWSGDDPVLDFLTENVGRMNWTEWMDSARAQSELTFADEAVPEEDLEAEQGAGNVESGHLPPLPDHEPDHAFMTDESCWLQADALTWREPPCADFAELFWLGPFAGWPHITAAVIGSDRENGAYLGGDENRLTAADALPTSDRRLPARPMDLRYLGEPDRGALDVRLHFGWSYGALSPPERAPVSFLVWVARSEPFPRTWRDTQREIRRQRDADAENEPFDDDGFRIAPFPR